MTRPMRQSAFTIIALSALCMAAPTVQAQGWISDIVNRASRAGDRIKADQEGNGSQPSDNSAAGSQGTSGTSETTDDATRKLEEATGSGTAPAAPVQPQSTNPVQAVLRSGTADPAAADKLEMVTGSTGDIPAAAPKPSGSRPNSAPKPRISIPAQDPSPAIFASNSSSQPASRPAAESREEPAPASSPSMPVVQTAGVEPESNWSIIRDLLSTEVPPIGSTGPILAALTPEAAASASVVPVVAATPEPTPAVQESKPKSTSSRRTSTPSRSSSSRRTTTQRSQPQPQPQQRRSLYNPYSTYSR